MERQSKSATLSTDVLVKALEFAGDGIMITDEEGVLLYVNDTFVRATGYSRGEVVGSKANLWKSERHPQGFYQNMWKTIKSGQTWSGEVTNRCKDGTLYDADAIIVPMTCEKGQKYFVGIHNDVTNHNKFQQQLRELNHKITEESHAKSNYFSHITHDIRGPLGAMMGILEVFDREGLSAEQQDGLSTVLRASKSLLGLINDVLDFSKLEAGKMTVTQDPFDLSEVLRTNAKLFAVRAKQKGIEISCEIEDQLLGKMYIGDEGKINRVMANLFGNALKFTHNGSVKLHASVKTAGDESHIIINIEDSGIGIAPDRLDEIFKQYTQAEESTSSKYGGTGLGLSICKEYAQLMGGDITVKSALGQGSIFTFSIPQKLASIEVPESTNSVNQEYSILVCEDEEFSQVYLLKLLKTLLGFKVELAKNGQIAVAKMAKGHFDLVLMDCNMPVMDGFEATKNILALPRPKDSPPPIIIGYSGLDDNQERQTCLDIGMSDFILKGSSPKALGAALKRWLK